MSYTIPRGFTLWDFNINTSSYRTFAWWGWLFIELDGEYLTINASGHAMGDKGDFCFRVHDSLTQEQANRMNIIAYRTRPDTLYQPKQLKLFNQDETN